jgi:hypothetical protein
MSVTLRDTGYSNLIPSTGHDYMTREVAFGDIRSLTTNEFKRVANMVQSETLIGKSFAACTTLADFLHGVTVETSQSLQPTLRQKINQLASLKPNWDGERAKQVKPHVLADVAETLRRLSQQAILFREPFLAPTFDGFVQMEWNENKRSLDVEAVQNGWSAVGTEVGGDEQHYYHSAEFERNDFLHLVKCYDWLIGVELIWPLL